MVTQHADALTECSPKLPCWPGRGQRHLHPLHGQHRLCWRRHCPVRRLRNRHHPQHKQDRLRCWSVTGWVGQASGQLAVRDEHTQPTHDTAQQSMLPASRRPAAAIEVTASHTGQAPAAVKPTLRSCCPVLPTGCTAGQGLAGGTCTPCTGNTFSAGGADAECSTCASGTIPNQQNSACIAGEWLAGRSELTASCCQTTANRNATQTTACITTVTWPVHLGLLQLTCQFCAPASPLAICRLHCRPGPVKWHLHQLHR